MRRELKSFSGSTGFTPLALIRLVSWAFLQNTIFKSFFFTSQSRVIALRLWGASIGSGVQIRRGVRIHFPWNLSIGNDCWIGEEVWIINHEKVVIGNDVCVSQRSVICSGGHDYKSLSLEFDHKPVHIADGAWICLDAKVLPGITIGKCSVVASGEIARASLPDYTMLLGGQIRPIDPPK